MEPGSSPNRGVTLDSAPPQPPGGPKRATLMDTQGGSSRGPGSDLGADAANPQLVIMQGMAMAKQGFDLMSAGLPQLAPAFMQIMTQLQQAIPQAMADQLAGTGPAGAGAGGMAPTPGPPSGPPAGAAPGGPAGGPPMA